MLAKTHVIELVRRASPGFIVAMTRETASAHDLAVGEAVTVDGVRYMPVFLPTLHQRQLGPEYHSEYDAGPSAVLHPGQMDLPARLGDLASQVEDALRHAEPEIPKETQQTVLAQALAAFSGDEGNTLDSMVGHVMQRGFEELAFIPAGWSLQRLDAQTDGKSGARFLDHAGVPRLMMSTAFIGVDAHMVDVPSFGSRHVHYQRFSPPRREPHAPTGQLTLVVPIIDDEAPYEPAAQRLSGRVASDVAALLGAPPKREAALNLWADVGVSLVEALATSDGLHPEKWNPPQAAVVRSAGQTFPRFGKELVAIGQLLPGDIATSMSTALALF
jgi:hypothetical protein